MISNKCVCKHLRINRWSGNTSSESRSVLSDSLWPHGLSMASSRPEHWSGQPFPFPGDLPNLGIEPRFCALRADSLPAEPPGKPKLTPNTGKNQADKLSKGKTSTVDKGPSFVDEFQQLFIIQITSVLLTLLQSMGKEFWILFAMLALIVNKKKRERETIGKSHEWWCKDTRLNISLQKC